MGQEGSEKGEGVEEGIIPYKGLAAFRGLIKAIMENVCIPDKIEKERGREIKA